MKEKLKISRGQLPMLCIAVLLALWLVRGTAALIQDGAGFASGALETWELAPEQAEMAEIALKPDGSLITQGNNPRMTWYNTDGRTFRSVTMTVTCADVWQPHEIAMRCTLQNGTEVKVYPIRKEEMVYTFLLPRGAITSLRLDPCSVSDLSLQLSLVVNRRLPAGWYYRLTWSGLFYGALYGSLAAAAMDLIWQLAAWAAKRKKG